MIFGFTASKMKQTPSLFSLLLSLFLIITIFTVVEGGGIFIGSAKKLFVFGDSYVDTGNFLNSPSFKPPSGITFPGKPDGRFCDGRVLPDYIGDFV
ncbi:GDSL esterase/lipase [Senna tora]|uniref:GDSL esterase/lipase n=1 Tax=Senna tora TaxID=362788 RepID=A0A834SPQ7_9FABA|nr:GDSL esterase/lipase [Senna tora]